MGKGLRRGAPDGSVGGGDARHRASLGERPAQQSHRQTNFFDRFKYIHYIPLPSIHDDDAGFNFRLIS